jgi:uncharacterized membrane protein YeaQ/YmgE (transglycosylase-associated protein family)
LIIGGILGWLASIIMYTNAQQGIVLNLIVGIVGALLASLLLTPLFGIVTINQSYFSLLALLISLLGAVILRRSSTSSDAAPCADPSRSEDKRR